MIKTEINWSEAEQVSKNLKTIKEQNKKENEENLQLAKKELWKELSKPNFRVSDFESICSDYGLDEDELFYSMI